LDTSLANKADAAPLLPENFSRWFASRGWAPRAHQLELLARARDDRSVLLIAPTGGGKTLAGFLPTLVESSDAAPSLAACFDSVRNCASEGCTPLYAS
jgi:ATP-dependent Lhr-like helicase